MKNIIIKPENTLLDALDKLQDSSLKCLIVVDKDNKLKGTITDGDIRRALLKKAKLNSKIIKYYHKNCYFIKKSLIKNIDSEKIFKKLSVNIIPVVDNNYKVINFIGEKIKNKKNSYFKNKNFEVIIMAGGLGTRLKPYTNILPKPLLPYENKTIIENVIDNFFNQGFKKFLISLNYKNILIKSFFKELDPYYKISFLEENKPLGTAGVLYRLRNKNKKFIVSNCDSVVDLNYNELINFHEKTNSDITLVVSTQMNKIPYGVCKVIENQLQNIIEKPEKNYLANVGLYVVNNKIFGLINKNENLSFVDLVKRALDKKKKINVFPISMDAWIDFGQSIEFIR